MNKATLIETHRRTGAREEDRRHLRSSRRIRPRRHARRGRAEARRGGRRRAEPALSLHAAADDVRLQHGGARRRPAAGDEPEGSAAPSSNSARRSSPGARSSCSTRRATGRMSSSASPSRSPISTRSSTSSAPRRTRTRRASTLMARDWPAQDVASLIALIDDPRHRVAADGTYRLSEAQARAILDLRLQRLTALGRDEIADELNKLAAEIADYLDILRSRARVHEHRQGRACRDQGRVRHAAPHRDRRAGSRRRGRGPDPARGHGRHRLARRLRQARAALDLPGAAARRQGPLGHADARRGFRRPAVRRLHPYAGAVLLVARTGLQGEGLAAAAGRAQGARQGARQHAAAGARRAHHHDHAAARGRGGLGQARRDVRHRPAACAATSCRTSSTCTAPARSR